MEGVEQEVVINTRLETHPYHSDKGPWYLKVYASLQNRAQLEEMRALNDIIKKVKLVSRYQTAIKTTTWIDPDRLMRQVLYERNYFWFYTPSVFTVNLSSKVVTAIGHIEHLPLEAYPLLAKAFDALIPIFQQAALLPPSSTLPSIQEFPVVVKSQTFLLKPKSTYTGDWHREGTQVSGVGQVYYHVSPSAKLLFRPRRFASNFATPTYTFDDDGSVDLQDGRTVVFSNDTVNRIEVRNESEEEQEISYVEFFLCNRSGDWKWMCLGGCVSVQENAVLLRRVLQLGEGFPLHLVEMIVKVAEWNGVVTEEKQMENVTLWRNHIDDAWERGYRRYWPMVGGGVFTFFM